MTQIIDAFVGVVRRPRFRCMVVDGGHSFIFVKKAYVITTHAGESYTLIFSTIGSGDNALVVRITPKDGGNHIFHCLFHKGRAWNVRKSALNFMKKLAMKPVYDVMNS